MTEVDHSLARLNIGVADEDWRDVLPLIDAAAEQMTLGDLLHGEVFTLYDSMSALEMMDPQMDAGMKSPAAAGPPTPPPNQIPLPDLVAILDEVLCGEIAWYNGLPLVQTIFRLDWMHVTKQLRESRLCAALIATARSTLAVRTLVLRGDVGDEEDFAPSSFGLDLREDVSDAEACRLLNAEEETLQVELRDAKARGSASKGMPDDAADADGKDENEVPRSSLLEAVLCRFRLRRALLVVMSNLSKPGAKAVEAVKKMVAFGLAQLPALRSSVQIGTPCERLPALSGRASSQLLGSAPQRKVELPERVVAMERLELLLAQLKTVCAITEVSGYDGLLSWLHATVSNTETSIITRSYAHLAGVSEERHALQLRPSLKPQLWAAVGELNGMPSDLWRSVKELEPCRERLDQLTQAAWARMRLSCLNRARERRKLRVYLIEWAPLQELADSLDSDLQNAGLLESPVQPFGTWVLTCTLNSMSRFLLLGFELDLYAPCEYQMIYFYLESLCDMRLQLYAATQHSANIQNGASTNVASKKESKGKKKGKADAKGPAKVLTGSAATRFELQMAAALRELSCGLTMLLGLLRELKLLPPADLEFTSLAMRFEQRFALFSQLVQPAPLPLERYFDMCITKLQELPREQLNAATASCLKNAKLAIEKILHTSDVPLKQAQKAELIALVKVAATNRELVLQLPLSPSASSTEPPPPKRARFNFETHASFPIVSIS
mmetsp:Transcript_22723/g.37581  ORF Transcript_22723/g.37581 Transcript_22723/m.37581 type:complete len:725 (+) Transcript_22723:133-2307(+)